MGLRKEAAAAPRTAVVERTRLIDRLRQRFVVRLTTVTGGAGSGKSTLLAQALASEELHVDVWYPCTQVDRDDDRLTTGLADACTRVLGGDAEDHRVGRSAEADLAVIRELVLSASPRQVCLVLDDVHLLDRSPSLDWLLEDLPTNGHVLLAGRTQPEVAIGRLDVTGALVEIDQDDLLLTEVEQVEFANLRGIDVALLDGTDGWPAFVELASSGESARSTRYLQEEAVAALTAERREALAAFFHVGGGDDTIARAVTGSPLDDLVGGLPLVRWHEEEAFLHDLWGELLAGDLSADAADRAALAAAAVHRRGRRFDRALDLAVGAAGWADVAEILGAAVLEGVDGGLRMGPLRRWRGLLPDGIADAPIGRLVAGLIAREVDPTSPATWEALDQAARGFAELGEPELELVALGQLGYVCRVAGDGERIAEVMARVEVLARHHPPAEPFLALGDAWIALTEGRADRQLAAMQRIRDAELPPLWSLTRDHLLAHSYLSLGRAEEGLAVVPTAMETLPVPIPGALVTESQCRWHSGDPAGALADLPSGLDDRHGARDRFIAGAWIALMRVHAGDVDGARQALQTAHEHTGDLPAMLVAAAQVEGLEILLTLVDGDEPAAAARLAGLLELVPLGDGVAEQMLRNNVALPYLLVPQSREFWDGYALGPVPSTMRAVAAALAAAREDGDDSALRSVDLATPGLLSAHFPVNWMIELGLRCVAAGRHEGRELVAWQCEHWGEPARRALRSWRDDPDLGDVAVEIVAHTPVPPDHSVEVKLLGVAELLIAARRSADPDWRRERVRGLLAFLVLNPTTTRERLTGALWPDLPIEKAQRNLRTTLNYLHGVLEPRRTGGDAPWFVRIDGQQVTLHDSLDVDLWHARQLLDRAEAAEREGRSEAALELMVEAVASWRGDLAADLDHEWLELERIHLRSRMVRACCRAAELLVATGRAEEAPAVIGPALDADPWHERAYRALADAYLALDDPTAAHQVLDRADQRLGVRPDR